jgi:flagellin-like hook-associated protein FlgL
VAARDASTGRSLGRVITDSDRIDGLIPGLTLFFDNTMNLKLDPEPPSGGSAFGNTMWPYYAPDETPALSITAPASAEDLFIHVAPNPLVLQVGANGGQSFSAFIPDVGARALGIAGLNVATQSSASAAIGTMDAAIGRAGLANGRVGGYQNSLAAQMRYLDVAAENTLAAESRIRDTDYASEIIALTRAQAMAASAAFALAQANLLPSTVLRLLS